MDVQAEKRALLTGLLGYVDNFEGGVRQTVNLFQAGNIEQAKQHTIEVIDGLGWIMEGVEVLRELLDIDVTDVKSTLEELQISLGNDDDVMTSDIFSNELLPILGTWKQRMMEVEQHPVSQG